MNWIDTDKTPPEERVNRSIQSEGVFAMLTEGLNFRRFPTWGNLIAPTVAQHPKRRKQPAYSERQVCLSE